MPPLTTLLTIPQITKRRADLVQESVTATSIRQQEINVELKELREQQFRVNDKSVGLELPNVGFAGSQGSRGLARNTPTFDLEKEIPDAFPTPSGAAGFAQIGAFLRRGVGGDTGGADATPLGAVAEEKRTTGDFVKAGLLNALEIFSGRQPSHTRANRARGRSQSLIDEGNLQQNKKRANELHQQEKIKTAVHLVPESRAKINAIGKVLHDPLYGTLQKTEKGEKFVDSDEVFEKITQDPNSPLAQAMVKAGLTDNWLEAFHFQMNAVDSTDTPETRAMASSLSNTLKNWNIDPARFKLRLQRFIREKEEETRIAEESARQERKAKEGEEAARLRPAFRKPDAIRQAGNQLGLLTPESVRGQQALPPDIKAALTQQLGKQATAAAARTGAPGNANEGITAQNYTRVVGELEKAFGIKPGTVDTTTPANDAEARLKFPAVEKRLQDLSKSAEARSRSLAIQTEINERSRLNRESRKNVSDLNRGDRISRAHAARRLRANLQTQKELHETGKATIADKRRRDENERQDNRRRQNIMLQFEQRGELEDAKQNHRLALQDASALIRFGLQAEAQVGAVASAVIASTLRANPSLGPDILSALEEAQERGDESLIATLSQALKGAFDANIMGSVYDHIAQIAHTSKNKFEQIARLQGAIQRTGDKESKEAKAYQWQIDLLKAPSHTILKDAADPTAGMRKDSQVTLKNGTHFLRLSTRLKEILNKNRAFGLGAFPEIAANNIKGILTDISRGFNMPGLDFSGAFNEDITIAKQLFLAAKFANAGAREPGRLTQIDVDSAVKGAEAFGSSLTAIAGLEGAEFEIVSRMGDAADITLNGFQLEISPEEAEGIMNRFADGLRAGKVDNKHLKSRIYSSLATQNITITTSAIDALVAGARSRAKRKKQP